MSVPLPLYFSHIQRWNLIVYSFRGSFIEFMSTAHKSLGKPVDVIKCCIMDYLIVQWIFPDSLATTHLQPRRSHGKLAFSLEGKHFWTRTQLREGAHERFAAPVRGRCERSPRGTRRQHWHCFRGEVRRPAGLGCVRSCEFSGGKQAVTVSGGFLIVQWLLNGIKWAIPWSCLGQYQMKDTCFSLCIFNTHTSI